MPVVFALLPEGFEEIEAITPIDLLRRAGATVTIAALADTLEVKGRCGLILRADTTLAALGPERPDCLLLPGGPGVRHLRADPRVRERVRSQHAAAGWLAAICAAPTVLHDAGVLVNRRYTAHFSVAAELTHIATEERVVVDGHIITSRGAGTALDFGLVLVERLFSTRHRSELAQSICA